MLTKGGPGRHWSQCWLCEIRHFVCPLRLLRARQYCRHFTDDIFKCIFMNENVWIPIKISLKFVHKGPFNNIPTFVKIMAWRRPGDKPLSEPMVVSLLMHICAIRPHWVKLLWPSDAIWHHKTRSSLPHIMVCCLMAPSHYLNHSFLIISWSCCCPASRTTLVARRFRVAAICSIIQVPHCIRVFFYFVWFVFINHIFQFYYELCTYCNILDIYLS